MDEFEIKEEFSSISEEHNNLLFQGDNVSILEILKKDYSNKIKCIYIDPPYNTKQDFVLYKDNFKNDEWIEFMRIRIEKMKDLLTEDGSLWISIDDSMQAYLRILCDEIFGIENYITQIIWEKKYTVSNNAKFLSNNHDFILIYAKNKKKFKINRLPRNDEQNEKYKNPDNHPKGPWKSTPLQVKGSKNQTFTHTFPNGVVWSPPPGRNSGFTNQMLDEMYYKDEIWFGLKGNKIPAKKTFLSELKSDGIVSRTIWRYDEVGHNHEAKEEIKKFNKTVIFDTPKPEKLLEKILFLATDEGDIVLDGFLGSGTTIAVAHKMNRKWIGIEMGEHIKTHCVPRIIQVINGEQGGISKKYNWKGGGGFLFYEFKEK